MTSGAKKKIKYFFIGIVCLLLIAFGIAQFWVSYRLNPFIDTFIKNGVVKASDSLYAISYRELSFTIPTRTLVLKDVVLKADTALYYQLKGSHAKVPAGLLDIRIAELKLTGIGFYNALVSGNLEGASIIIDNPTVTYTRYDTLTRTDSLEKEVVYFDLYKLFSAKFHSLSVQKIKINNGICKIFKSVIDTQAIVSSSGIAVDINNLKIDSAYSVNRYELNLAKNMKIAIAEAHWILPDSIYRLQFSKMVLEATNQSLKFEKIEVVPLANKYEMAKITGFGTALNEVTVDSLALHDLDLNLLLYNHSISCGLASIENLNLKSFLYKAAPRKSGNKVFPMDHLRNAPLLIRIDTVKIKNGRIEYAEQIPGNNNPGSVFFSNISGVIANITNDYRLLNKNNFCRMDIDGLFMGRGKLKVNAAFDLTSMDDEFTIAGTLGKMDLLPLNPMILQTADIKLEKGTVDNVTFDISGSGKTATGNMVLLYHDLAVMMMKTETDKNGNVQKVEKKNIKAFLANAIALISDNPKNNITRRVVLHKDRDPEKSLLNFIWQTFLSGLKETMLSSIIKKEVGKLQNLNNKVKKMPK